MRSFLISHIVCATLTTMIKAVLFDVDGVLLDSFEANLKFFKDLMRFTGYQPPTADRFRSMTHMTFQNLVSELTGLTSQEKIEKIIELRKNGTVPYPDELLRAPTELVATLQTLSRRYPLGVVTSRFRQEFDEASVLHPVVSLFSTIVAYEDTKKHKPHPEPMLLAAQRLGVSPSECVYIGDAQTDFEAATNAGMQFLNFAQIPLDGAAIWTDDFKKIPELIFGL